MAGKDFKDQSSPTIESVLRRFKTSAAGSALITLEASFSLPIPHVTASGAYLNVFVFTTQRMKASKVLKIFAPHAAVVLDYPNGRLCRYNNYRLASPFGKMHPDAQTPIGEFPHPTIAQLSPKEYASKRSQYGECVRKVLQSGQTDSNFMQLLGLLIEPALSAYYWHIAPPGLKGIMEK